jgi:hypothetical protein
MPHDAAGWDAYDRMLADRYLGGAMEDAKDKAGSAAERKQMSYEMIARQASVEYSMRINGQAATAPAQPGGDDSELREP